MKGVNGDVLYMTKTGKNVKTVTNRNAIDILRAVSRCITNGTANVNIGKTHILLETELWKMEAGHFL